YPRRRAVAACQLCRRRKTKCDNARPSCGFCTGIGATCEFDPASLALLGKMDYMISLLEHQKASPAESLPGQSGSWAPIAIESPESLEIPPKCNLSFRILKWPVFSNARYGHSQDSVFAGYSEWTPQLNGRSQGIVEDDIPLYVQRFLANVHTKNPVIDHVTLVQHSREAVENGLHWDGPTTLVLITCALGLLSQPFRHIPVTAPRDLHSDRALADVYYIAAKKRMGLLDPTSLIYIQCSFLSGIYEMYSLRPLLAWYAFHSACSAMQLYFRVREPRLEVDSSTQGLEQRLHWSCFKSERHNSTGFPLEESWYYYLTEISQRRILDRILNAFYSQEDDGHWCDVCAEDMIRIATELEQQVITAASNLPDWFRYSPDHPEDRELPFFVHRRILYLQELILIPFLYRVIHSNTSESPIVHQLANRCVEVCRINILENSIQHRHHGSWFIAIGAFRCALCLIAAAQSDKVQIPADLATCVETSVAILDFWGQEAVDL
ncbi:vegetative cell wall protein gp1, partial [Xylogone sp. PMI_703]